MLLNSNIVSSLLNTREVALITWLLIGLVWLIVYPTSRDWLYDLIKAIFPRNLSILYLCTIIYLSITIYFLYNLNVWNISLLKDTIIWIIITSSVLLYNVGKTKTPIKFLQKTVLATIGIATIIGFISNLEPFPYWVEFISIPIAILVSGIYVISESKEEFAQVRSVLKKAFALFSFGILLYLIYFSVGNYKKYINWETAKQFMLPILLTILYIPYLSIVSIYVQYEDIATSLSFKPISSKVLRIAILNAIYYFNLNIQGLFRWKNAVTIKDFENSTSIKNSMKRILDLQKQEKIPPKFIVLEGWDPKFAKNILKRYNLQVDSYQSELGEHWQGKSKSLNMSEDRMTSETRYTITGTRFVVKNVKLHLSMYDPSLKSELLKFIDIVNELCLATIYQEITIEMKDHILNRLPLDYESDFGIINIRFAQWRNEKKGFDVYFDINYKF